MTEGRPGAEGLKGRHVLLALVAFFGVMLIANGIFVYYALATFGGGDTGSPYQKGLHYNDTIVEAERQGERGWRATLDYREGRFALLLRDRQDQPVRGATLGGSIGRPATDRQDVSVELNESGPGRYTAEVDLAPGQWVVQLHSEDASPEGDPTYRLKQRLFVDASR
jgi:nitrogen fixation protein FixH